MSIILGLLFMVFIIKFSFFSLDFAFRLFGGLVGIFVFIMILSVVGSFLSALFSLLKMLLPLVAIAAVIWFIAYLVRKEREDNTYV